MREKFTREAKKFTYAAASCVRSCGAALKRGDVLMWDDAGNMYINAVQVERCPSGLIGIDAARWWAARWPDHLTEPCEV